MKRGSKLSDLQENVTLVSQECSDDCIGEDLWTSTFAAPYLSILGIKKKLTLNEIWLQDRQDRQAPFTINNSNRLLIVRKYKETDSLNEFFCQ